MIRTRPATEDEAKSPCAMTTLPPHAVEGYIALRTLPDGRVAGVKRLLFHWTLHVGIDADGYEDRYCYGCILDALADLGAWTGEGDPPGHWHKHPSSGRRRDPDTGEIWYERDDAKRARAMEATA